MIWLQFAVVLLFIFIGARIGGMGIGLAGAAGVIVLGLLGLPVDPIKHIPWDVIGIIGTVICAIAALQQAGGLDHLVHVTEKLLRKHPKRITFFAPVVTYFMTVFCGTGHVAFSALPVITEVAKETGIRPSKPLSISVVASQIAISASPISAAMIAMTAAVEPLGVGYITLLAICIPVCFIGCMAGAVVAHFQGCPLEDDPVYQERLKQGLIKKRETVQYIAKPHAVKALWIFGAALVITICYAALISKQVGIIAQPPLSRDAAIMTFMMLTALIIMIVSKEPIEQFADQSTFKGGMTANMCILGVVWLGNTFVKNYLDLIQEVGGSIVNSHPWMLAIVLFFASALLYSQASTTATLMPVAAGIGISGATMVAAFPAVTGLYLLPTYPTTVAAIQFDDTGSTRIGKFVFNHPFILPGVVSVTVSVLLGFAVVGLVL